MKPRRFVLTLPMLIAAISAGADLELTTEIEYPRRLQIKIPVEEDSDFQMRTSFGRGDFFSATGHIGRITKQSTNRNMSLSYRYEYRFGQANGSVTGSEEAILNSPYTLRVVASIYDPNPAFTIREVPPPVSPSISLTNGLALTNAASTVPTNSQRSRSGPVQQFNRDK